MSASSYIEQAAITAFVAVRIAAGQAGSRQGPGQRGDALRQGIDGTPADADIQPLDPSASER